MGRFHRHADGTVHTHDHDGHDHTHDGHEHREVGDHSGYATGTERVEVLELILDVKSRGIPIILISHNMPHVFEVADRIHVHRLGKRLCVIDPKDHSMSDAVAYMTGAETPPELKELA